MLKRNVNILFLLVILIFSMVIVSCKKNEDSFSEGVSEFEKYIYNDLSSYISIGKIQYESDGLITINVFFLEDYFSDESQTSAFPPSAVYDSFISLYNQFTESNPAYFGDNTRVNVVFYDYGESGFFDYFFVVKNYYYLDSKWLVKKELCSIDFCDKKTINELINTDSIEFINMNSIRFYDDNIDELNSLIDRFPYLKCVSLSDEYISDDLMFSIKERYPTISFIG